MVSPSPLANKFPLVMAAIPAHVRHLVPLHAHQDHVDAHTMARPTHLGNQCHKATAAINVHASLMGKCNVLAIPAGVHIMAKPCGMVRLCPARPTVAIPVHVEVLDRFVGFLKIHSMILHATTSIANFIFGKI